MERQKILNQLSDEDYLLLQYEWRLWARQNQIAPPGMWDTWLILAGRGFGKTRSGAEWIREKKEQGAGRMALIGPTAADVRDTMVEGESGLLAISPPWDMPEYQPSKRRIVWPNGAKAFLYSAEEPERLRGPQHEHAWADELCAWRYMETWDQLQFGLRLGKFPQVCVTTTPKPQKLLKDLVADATTVITKGSTDENMGNLAPKFVAKLRKKYEGTRLGRQELNAEILDDNPNALFRREDIDQHRMLRQDIPDMVKIVVGVDPSVTNKKSSDECGIIVAGIDANDHGYVFSDRSDIMHVREWAKEAIRCYDVHEANLIVAEVNNGGDLVEETINSAAEGRSIKIKQVRASRGKDVRAEPLSLKYEQGRIHHVGTLGKLEDEMCDWDPSDTNAPSPNRVDALVWAFAELYGEADKESNLRAL